MRYRLTSRKAVQASIDLPLSKSFANRLIVLQYLAGKAIFLPAGELPNDILILHDILMQTGKERDAKDAGTAMRFATAVLACIPGTVELTGTERMLNRPIGPLVESLNQLGAKIQYIHKKGFPPLLFEGRLLKGGRVKIDAGISSQFVSALMMIAPLCEQEVIIEWEGLMVSAPYVLLTIELMKRFGAEVSVGDRTISVKPGGYHPVQVEWEKDWSSSAFFFICAALNPGLEITFPGLRQTDIQGDKQVMKLFEKLGVRSKFTGQGLIIVGDEWIENPSLLEVDFTEIPDLVQPFVMACAGRSIHLRLSGLHNLHLKETDRLEALTWNANQLGCQFRVQGTMAQLEKVNEPLPNLDFRVYGDHRMAMSIAPLVSIYGMIELNEVESVNKSFPRYWEELVKTGITFTPLN